jgi:periplasmic divalent cation tolerance protein
MSSVMCRPYPRRPLFHARSGQGEDDGVDEECCEVVVTAGDPDWLAGFTRTLVEERLAACGHQVGAIRSVYRWQGAVHDEPEARVALHTRRSLVPAIVARADALHPYEVPCVIALPLVGGNPAYLRWVAEETRADNGDAAPPGATPIG